MVKLNASNVAVIEVLREAASAYAGAMFIYKRQYLEWYRWRYEIIGDKLEKAHVRAEDRLDDAITRLEFYDEDTYLSVVQIDYPRHDILGLFQADLKMEQAIQSIEKRGIAVAMGLTEPDDGSSKVFEDNLKKTEKLIRRFEGKIRTITKDIGVAGYLQEHIH